jgi:regulator of sigma E protease
MGMSLWSLFTGRVSFKESFTGPIGILYMTSEAARMGVSPLLYLISIFSLSLAIFNLFPLPILDGGHLAFLAIERLRGAPLSLRIQEQAARVSFALLLALLVAVCINDVSRFGLMQKLMGLWGG